MKKYLFLSFLILLFLSVNCSFAETNFSKAIRTCEKYSQTGSASYQGQLFSILITVDKDKKDKCTYKEKIYQGKDYQMLTCHFDMKDLPFIANSMSKYTDKYRAQISKNLIFEAKMTTNAEVFQKFIANPQYCSISHSKK